MATPKTKPPAPARPARAPDPVKSRKPPLGVTKRGVTWAAGPRGTAGHRAKVWETRQVLEAAKMTPADLDTVVVLESAPAGVKVKAKATITAVVAAEAIAVVAVEAKAVVMEVATAARAEAEVVARNRRFASLILPH